MKTRPAIRPELVENPSTEKATSIVEALDELVQEVFAARAASINNSGIQAQVDLLRREGWTEEEISASVGAEVFSTIDTEVLYEVVEDATGTRTTQVWVGSTGDEQAEEDEAFDFYPEGVAISEPVYQVVSIERA